MTDAPACTECGAFVQKDWDWCEACGFDPNHLKPDHWTPSPEPRELAPVAAAPRASTWAPVATFRPEEPVKLAMPRRPPPRSATGWLVVLMALALAVLVVGFGTTRVLGQDMSTIVAGKVGPTASTLPPWALAKSPDADYSVYLPGPPDIADGKTKDGLPEHTMIWTKGVDVYRVSAHDAPVRSATVEQQRAQLETMAAELTARGSTTAIIDRNGKPALSFEGRNVDGQPLKGLLVVGWKHVIAVVVSGPGAVAESSRFFDSLVY